MHRTMLLSDLLNNMSRTETMVPNEQDRATLAAASEIVKDPTRVVVYKGDPVVVLVVGGANADPLGEAMTQLEEQMDELASLAYQMKDKLVEIHELEKMDRDK